MQIGIIGTGAIGATLARKFSAAGHDVAVANSRGPSTISAEVLEFGARAVTTGDAVADRDAIVLSIPFGRIPDIAPLLKFVPNQTVVIDTSNYFPQLNGNIDAVDSGQVESLWVAEKLGRPVVKAWNAVLAGTLQTKALPHGSPNRIAIPVAGDIDEHRQTAMGLVDDSGFDPFDAGALADSWRQQPMTPAYCTELTSQELGPALEKAQPNEAPRKRDHVLEGLAAATSAPTLDELVEANRSFHRPDVG